MHRSHKVKCPCKSAIALVALSHEADVCLGFSGIVNTWRIKPFFRQPDRKLLLHGQQQRQLVGRNMGLQRCPLLQRERCEVSWLVPFIDAHLWKCIRSTVTRRWVAWDRWQPRSRITHSHLVLYALILCCSCQEIQLNQSVVIIGCGHPILIQIYHVGGDKCRIWRARTADSMATDKR